MSKKFNIHEWQAKRRLLNEQEQPGLELTDEEKDMVSDTLEDIYARINPTNDIEKYTALFKYIDGWFEVHGGTYEENIKEMSATGTGTSFNAGSGEGYMTPKAFKKKRKDD